MKKKTETTDLGEKDMNATKGKHEGDRKKGKRDTGRIEKWNKKEDVGDGKANSGTQRRGTAR